MGDEFGQWTEWGHEQSLEWHALNFGTHQGVHQWVKDLNRLYRQEKALFEDDFTHGGFQWIEASDYRQSVLSFLRKGKNSAEQIVVVCNFTPATHDHYRVGVPAPGLWKELLNSDAQSYGGSGQGNLGG